MEHLHIFGDVQAVIAAAGGRIDMPTSLDRAAARGATMQGEDGIERRFAGEGRQGRGKQARHRRRQRGDGSFRALSMHIIHS